MGRSFSFIKETVLPFGIWYIPGVFNKLIFEAPPKCKNSNSPNSQVMSPHLIPRLISCRLVSCLVGTRLSDSVLSRILVHPCSLKSDDACHRTEHAKLSCVISLVQFFARHTAYLAPSCDCTAEKGKED